MSHIFISYSKENIDFVRYLRALLEREGFAVWVDEARLSPSARWWKSIEQNIDGCGAFVVVMSPDAAESDWVEREILLAEKFKRPIFPVLLIGEAWSRLANIQYEDMRAGLGAKLSPRLVNGLHKRIPQTATKRGSIDFTVEWGDIGEVKADVAAFKFAQYYYGADLMMATRLTEAGVPQESFRPTMDEIGDYRFVETKNTIEAPHALFVGTAILRFFGYQQIREFAARVLSSLADVAPDTRHLAMTLHGPGRSLDEIEALLSQFAGLRDGLLAGAYPPALERISIIERKEALVERMRNALDAALADSDYATPWTEGWGYHLKLSEEEDSSGEPDAIESAGAKDIKPHVYVAMPFDPDLEDVFYFGIQAPVHARGLLCERTDQSTFSDDLLEQIKMRIDTATVVIADLTGADANVYLQLGYAWGKQRPTILLVKAGAQLPIQPDTPPLSYQRIKDLEAVLGNALDSL